MNAFVVGTGIRVIELLDLALKNFKFAIRYRYKLNNMIFFKKLYPLQVVNTLMSTMEIAISIELYNVYYRYFIDYD